MLQKDRQHQMKRHHHTQAADTTTHIGQRFLDQLQDLYILTFYTLVHCIANTCLILLPTLGIWRRSYTYYDILCTYRAMPTRPIHVGCLEPQAQARKLNVCDIAYACWAAPYNRRHIAHHHRTEKEHVIRVISVSRVIAQRNQEMLTLF